MKVSVIVNIYNNIFSLYFCLKSIKEQTLKNIEIILINNNNNKYIDKVIQNFINKYNGEVILINDLESDIASLKNKAIHISNGEYIKFIDSRDYLDKLDLELMYNEALNNNLNCVVSKGYQRFMLLKFKDDFNYGKSNGIHYEELVLGNKLFKKDILLDNLFLDNVVYENISNIPSILNNDSIKYIDNRLFIKGPRFISVFKKEDNISDIFMVLEYLKLKINKKEFKSIAILHILKRLENMYYTRTKDDILKSKLKDYLYSIDNYWSDFEIIKVYAKKDMLFRFFIKHSKI